MKHKLLYAIILSLSLFSVYSQQGSVCNDAIPITLPFDTRQSSTLIYGDDTDVTQPPGCGAVPGDMNYMTGAEVFYSYTATFSGQVSVRMQPSVGSSYSSIFVYNGCDNVGVSCIAGFANASISDRIFSFNVSESQTYIIVVSSGAGTQSVTYNLLIQREDCDAFQIDNYHFNPGQQMVQLNWDVNGGYETFQVAVQDPGGLVPQGDGITITESSYTATGLEPGKSYQYWIRAFCNSPQSGFTAWQGPYAFNTSLCPAEAQCNYTFRMSDTGNNGWQGATFDILQNNIRVNTIGPGFSNGGGPVDVILPMCPNLPFEIIPRMAGSQPSQVRLQVLNSFGQTIYTKPSSVPPMNQVLYAGEVTCNSPQCNIPPVNVTIPSEQITTTGFTIKWSAVATSSWDIYVVPQGGEAPNAWTLPTYSNVMVADLDHPSFVTTVPLLPDTTYKVYVRVNCEPMDSAWSEPAIATTLPICAKPVSAGIDAASITQTSATVTWENGSASDSQWEILLVPGPELPMPAFVPAPVDGLLFTVNSPSPFTVTELEHTTIYYYFIRTVCAVGIRSSWQGPLKFNTLSCSPEDKCSYKFTLTDSGLNGWNGGKMVVRQNGIPVEQLLMTSGSTITRNVALCPNVLFDVYWSEAGNAPEEIGLIIQNPFLDTLYTKAAGQGSSHSVLYTAMANCTDLPCARPTIGEAVNITSHSATLQWTDNTPASPGMFDLYVVVNGAGGPGNDSETVPTHSGVTSGYMVDGLQPSTRYQWYVRQQCDLAEYSNWTVLPSVFITKPVNDDPENAHVINVNPGQQCNEASLAAGSTYGATNSSPASLSGPDCGTADDDIWYTFTATGSTHYIHLIDILGSTATVKLNHSLYVGLSGDLSPIYCSQQPFSVANGLTAGTVYFIRVYTSGTNPNQYATFKVCVTSPENNDLCLQSVNIPVNATRNCALSRMGSTLGAGGSEVPVPPGAGCGSPDDDVWYHFTAVAETHIIRLSDVAPPTMAAQLRHSLYSGSECDTLNLLYCSISTTSVATNLIIGNTYKLRIYTAPADASIYAAFNVCITTPPAVPNDECLSAISIPMASSTECSNLTPGAVTGATPSPQLSSCPGTEDDDVWYSFIATSGYGKVQLTNVSGGPLTVSLQSGNCNELTQIACSTDNSLYASLIPGELYYVRVWSTSNLPTDILFNICVSKAASPCTDKVVLSAFLDQNANGIKDPTETPFTYGSFHYTKNDVGEAVVISSSLGTFSICQSAPTDFYDFSYVINSDYAPYYTSASGAFENVVIASGGGVQNILFPIVVSQPYHDVAVKIISRSTAQAGFYYRCDVVIMNKGLLPSSGTMTFVSDPLLTIVPYNDSDDPLPSGMPYTFNNLLPGQTLYKFLKLAVPSLPTVNIGDLVTNSVTVSIPSDDINLTNNFFSYTTPIVAAYDPNDKSESHGSQILINEFSEQDYLNYTIRFQNEGTADAVNIYLEDSLDPSIDENSLIMGTASHDFQLQRIGNDLIWTFENINLPGKFEDEEGSQGYVQFAVKLKPGFQTGDIVENTASIYFDSNPPIITNTVLTEFVSPLGMDKPMESNIVIYPNPASQYVRIDNGETDLLDSVRIYDLVGKSIRSVIAIRSAHTTISTADLPSGIYLMEIKTAGHIIHRKKLLIK